MYSQKLDFYPIFGYNKEWLYHKYLIKFLYTERSSNNEVDKS